MGGTEGFPVVDVDMTSTVARLMNHPQRPQPASGAFPSSREPRGDEEKAANQVTRRMAYSFTDMDGGQGGNGMSAQRHETTPLAAQWRVVRTSNTPIAVPQKVTHTTGTTSTDTPVQIPALGLHFAIGSVSTSSSKTDSSMRRFYPIFLRRRVVPDRHAVATDDVGRDIIQDQESLSSGKIGASAQGSLLRTKMGKEEEHGGSTE